MLKGVPEISVVVATYNGEQFLAAQLDSILAQTLPPKEIIIVDDGSTDGTVEILKEYAAADSRFSIFFNEKNLGYIGNFEKGMLLTTCSLVALSDQDDLWVSHKLETLYNHIGDHLLVYCDSELIDIDGNRLHKKMSDIRNQIAYHSCLMYTIGAWAPGHAMLFKRTLIEKCIPFTKLTTHDFWLGFVATFYTPINYVSEVLVYYRQHSNNAIGANTQSNKIKQKPTRKQKLQLIRNRMKLLYEKCPEDICSKEKAVLKIINESYQSFTLRNNWIRMTTFFRYRNLILAYKKKSALMKYLFCIKMFFKID